MTAYVHEFTILLNGSRECPCGFSDYPFTPEGENR